MRYANKVRSDQSVGVDGLFFAFILETLFCATGYPVSLACLAWDNVYMEVVGV